MSLRQTFANPFYLLLTIAGVIFCVTACAYGVMTVRGLHHQVAVNAAGATFMEWIDEFGFRLMLGELAVLGVCCVLAIATDGFWEKRYAKRCAEDQDSE
jgi:hypothetical protein